MAHPENGDRRPYFWNFIIYDSGVKYKYKKEMTDLPADFY